MTEDPASIKSQAEWLRICLEYGLASRDEVISWADRHIAESDRPEPSVIDVALATAPTQDLLGLLGAVPGEVEFQAIYARFFGELAKRLRNASDLVPRVARILRSMALTGKSPNARAEAYMQTFTVDLDLGEYAGRDVEELRTRILAFLDSNSGVAA